MNEDSNSELDELKKLSDLLDNITDTLQNPPTNPIDDLSVGDDLTQLMESYNSLKEGFNVVTHFINDSENEDPFYSNTGDSGFDLRAHISEPVTIKPLERKLIQTGLKFQLSENTELQVRPRSGMTLKHGITVLNTPGTVDEGYRGEVGIIVINLSNEKYTIQPGERIAQGVIMNVIGQGMSKLVNTNKLNETERGSGGFGSTGK